MKSSISSDAKSETKTGSPALLGFGNIWKLTIQLKHDIPAYIGLKLKTRRWSWLNRLLFCCDYSPPRGNLTERNMSSMHYEITKWRLTMVLLKNIELIITSCWTHIADPNQISVEVSKWGLNGFNTWWIMLFMCSFSLRNSRLCWTWRYCWCCSAILQ